jgi:hypothetical protein
MIRNFKLSNIGKSIKIVKDAIWRIQKLKFSENVGEVVGLKKPLLVKSNPRNQMFYGKKFLYKNL